VSYVAFVDPAGGSGADSMTLAIAHATRREGRVMAVLDAIAEWRPPFSPDATTADAAAHVRRFRLARVTGDAYAGEWPREAFRKHGIDYSVSERTKGALYRELLPLINSRRVELLDHPRLLAQLTRLERRTARGGRDSIDHGPRGHDDLANAAAGALVLAATSGATEWTAAHTASFSGALDALTTRANKWDRAEAGAFDWRRRENGHGP
jgi:hypothetical protein